MSAGQVAIKGSKASEAVSDWQAIRAASDIQYGPMKITEPPQPTTPPWLEAIGRFLKRILEPLGEAIGMGWPVLSKLMIAVAVLAALFILWRLVSPALGYRRKPPAEPVPAWTPNRAEALALLEDADRLAHEGRYDEATHLLLRRSVIHIAEARPDLLHPASTAREIAEMASLPMRARAAFALISVRVERCRYALLPLAADDWQAARAAYADFALAELAA